MKSRGWAICLEFAAGPIERLAPLLLCLSKFSARPMHKSPPTTSPKTKSPVRDPRTRPPKKTTTQVQETGEAEVPEKVEAETPEKVPEVKKQEFLGCIELLC